MDPELKTLLAALLDGQVKLAEGQQRLTERMDQLAAAQEATERRLVQLAERVDVFTHAVIRGFTDGAGRDHAIEARLERLEKAVFKKGRR